MKPIVAIVGRPNVGKSTFFNRITKTRNALVEDYPGVTRDRIYGDAKWNDVEFTLIDTGGFTEEADDFALLIRSQVGQAIEDADAIIFLMDGKGGISPFDKDIINNLRAASKPVFYVVNKIDSPEQETGMYEFYSLGIEKVYPVSAEHGYGINDFADVLTAVLSVMMTDHPTEENSGAVAISVVGRPNVGKSSLINQILGQKRHLVSDAPGTTRDAVDSFYTLNQKLYRLVDTAGIRRKGQVKRKLEKFSVVKALKSLEKCDVALIVLDAIEGITDQDMNIAGYAYDRRCGCIFLLNKWDLLEKDSRTAGRFYDQVRHSAKFLQFAPVMSISALTGLRVNRIFDLVDRVYNQYCTRVSTGRLNQILEQAIQRTEPSLYRGKRLKYYYATQISAKPPTIVCFVNYPEGVHFSYKRYLINQIRTETGLDQTPIRLIFRKRTGRIKGKK